MSNADQAIALSQHIFNREAPWGNRSGGIEDAGAFNSNLKQLGITHNSNKSTLRRSEACPEVGI